jgi:2-polyprenyl-6-methoxyphenol hydroxylase-like FAD-dependent oxidoreductase
VFVGGRPAALSAALAEDGGPAAAYRGLLGRIGLGDRLAESTPAGPVRYVRGLPAGYLRRPHGPGWALVGDAGHWLDPMSTHGMTSALRDAQLLSDALIGTEPDDQGRRPALAGYRATRDRLSEPMLRASDEIAAHDWDPLRVRRLLRAMSAAMADEVDAIATSPAA